MSWMTDSLSAAIYLTLTRNLVPRAFLRAGKKAAKRAHVTDASTARPEVRLQGDHDPRRSSMIGKPTGSERSRHYVFLAQFHN